MTSSPECPKCGAELPSGVPGGLCPMCLLQAGLATESSAGASAVGEATSGAASFVPPNMAELADLFPQLEILELLGQGGMGAVYKARQRGLDRLVALKILPPQFGRDPTFAERFLREARALARLSHGNIVSVYDFGETRGLPAAGGAGERLYFIVMEYVDGVNLRQAIQGGQLAPRDALAIVPQICEALQFAHDEGVVHRDIKPENILIDKKGRVKIADFGLAKLLVPDAADHALTGTHQVMGTVRYMAPEQMEASRAVDHRADIYSLGVVFYEMLTGELPLGRFAPPSEKVAIDVRLDDIVLRTLAKEPERRYQRAGEVKTDVESIMSGAARTASAATPASSLPSLVGPSVHATQAVARRPRLVPVLAVLNLLGALLFMLVSAWEPPAPFTQPIPRIWQAWAWADMILGFTLAAGLFTASIGLLLWQSWARRLVLAVSVFGLASLVFDMPHVARFLLPDAVADLQHSLASEGMDADTAEFVAGINMTVLIGGVLLSCVTWLIAQLVYFTRPRVVAAFPAAPAATSRAGQFTEWLFTGTGTVIGLISVFGPLLLMIGLAAWLDKRDTTMPVDPESSHEDSAIDGAASGSSAPLATGGTFEFRLERTLKGGTAAWSLNLSPDGRWLAAACDRRASEGILRIWDLRDLKAEFGMPSPVPVQRLAFAADSERVFLAGDYHGNVMVANRVSQKFETPWDGLADRITCLSTSPDGRRLVTGHGGGTLLLWDVAERKVIKVLSGHHEEVRSVAFAPDSRRLASAGLDRDVRVWDADTGQPLLTLQRARDRVEQVRFSPDGQVLAAAGWDHLVWLWDAQTGDDRGALRAHTDKVTGIAFAADGSRAVTACWDGTLALWDLQSKHVLAMGEGKAQQTLAVEFLPDRERIVSAHRNGEIKVWRVSSVW